MGQQTSEAKFILVGETVLRVDNISSIRFFNEPSVPPRAIVYMQNSYNHTFEGQDAIDLRKFFAPSPKQQEPS